MVAGCAGQLEAGRHTAFRHAKVRMDLGPPPKQGKTFDGTFNGYVAFALKHSPTARAAFERWRSATLKVSKSRRLPEPNLNFGYFVRSVETRVGPQRFKIGLSQTFPWPTKLSAIANAASKRAHAAQKAFEAELIAIRKNVAVAYWRLWLIHEEHRLKTEHDAVLEALAGTVRGRVKTGSATLADLTQVELTVARHHDHSGEHKQAMRKVSAQLLTAIGSARRRQTLKTNDEPTVGLPMPKDSELRTAALEHPHIKRHGYLAESQRQRASAERAERYPMFRVGVDYIETEDAALVGVPDSGKDPLIISAGVSLPLWWGNYSDAERAARAAEAAHHADQEAAMRRAEGALESALASVRDTKRRVGLYEKTLVPQAETTFQAVLGGYQTGRSTVSAVILAQRDLLELQLENAKARAKHAMSWADLESVAGREIEVSGERK